MTTSQSPDFHLNRPGVLIAALPAVLGFVPEKSLVLVTVDRGEMGCVMRVDLSDELVRLAGARRRRGRGGEARFGDRSRDRRGRGQLPDVQRRIPRTGRPADDGAGRSRDRTARRARRRPGGRGRALALRRRLRQRRHRRRPVGVAAGRGRGPGRPPALRPACRAARGDRRDRSRPHRRARRGHRGFANQTRRSARTTPRAPTSKRPSPRPRGWPMPPNSATTNWPGWRGR